MISRRSTSLMLVLPVLWGGVWQQSDARADEWGPVETRDFFSANRKFCFRVSPDETDPIPRPGFCKGELYENVESGPRLVWSRYLINDVAPVKAYVSDSGAYAVTMDEWGRMGTLPIVIYGWRGELVSVHSLETLRLVETRDHVKKTVSSEWWSEKSLVLFGPQEKTILIRLHWGEMLAVRLQDGKVLSKQGVDPDEWQVVARFIEQRAGGEILKLLRSEDPQDRETGAVHAGQLRVADAVPRLRELLADDASYTAGVLLRKQVYFVREAARQALQAISRQPSTSNVAGSRPSP